MAARPTRGHMVKYDGHGGKFVRAQKPLFWKQIKLKIWQDVDTGGSFVVLNFGTMKKIFKNKYIVFFLI